MFDCTTLIIAGKCCLLLESYIILKVYHAIINVVWVSS